MSSGWKLVASLGSQGPRYPQILVDNHGWCLRLGPSARQDEKYYSSFSSLLKGLVEQLLRRRLKSGETLEGLSSLIRSVEGVLREAGELCTSVRESVIHEHIRRCGLTGASPRAPVAPSTSASVQLPDRPSRREAVAAV
jgi:hypothetical protein